MQIKCFLESSNKKFKMSNWRQIFLELEMITFRSA